MIRNIGFFFILYLVASLNASAADCGKIDLHELFNRPIPKVLFIGEFHGTQEVPAAYVEIVCSLIAKGHRVLVALEFPVDWAADLENFVSSQSDESKKANSFFDRWNQLRTSSPDGRTSLAMWAAMNRLRDISNQNPKKLEIIAFDTRPWEPKFKNEFAQADLGLASTLVRAIEIQNEAVITVVLTGELHARMSENTWLSKPRPMAWLVQATRPSWKMNSLKVNANGGTHWACLSVCGSFEIKKLLNERPTPIPVAINFKKIDSEGFGGELFFNNLTVSPPFNPQKKISYPEPVSPPWRK
jgi:hypothetical protein